MNTWPLPDHPHVPGQTERPIVSPAFDAAAAAPVYTVDRMWPENETYLYGLQLYQAGFFWEAHEVWEPVWMRSAGNSRERLLVQGLIQLSNACLKIRMGRPQAAARLLAIAHQKIMDAAVAGAMVMGIPLRTLADAIERFAQQLAQNSSQNLAQNPAQSTQTLLRQRPALAVEQRDRATPV